MRYLMIVSYDGKNYSGFQKQKNANSIQQELENAISILTKEQVNCIASGRTDAKVSAYFQPVHFEIQKEIDTNKFIRSVNGILNDDIRVLSITETNLHARFSAKQKTYMYKMYASNIDLPLEKDSLKINPNLNFKNMKKFLKCLIGTHDFIGFRASGGENETTVRTISKIKLVRNGINYNLLVTGNGFLYKMVRNIVGTMLAIGDGKLNLAEIKPTLFTTFKATNTAKPEYLYLLNVKY